MNFNNLSSILCALAGLIYALQGEYALMSLYVCLALLFHDQIRDGKTDEV